MLSVACKWKQKYLTEDASLVAGWQPHVNLEPEKEDEWSDTPLNLLTADFR